MVISKHFDVDIDKVRSLIRPSKPVDMERIVAERMLSWQKESLIYFISSEMDDRRSVESRSVENLSTDIRKRIRELSQIHDSIERKLELSKMVYFLYARRKRGKKYDTI